MNDLIKNEGKIIENEKYIKRMWEGILRRKMFFFGTTLRYNFGMSQGSEMTMINYNMLCGMGYLGGISWNYWTSLALLQYYIDPIWIGCGYAPNYGTRDFYRKGELHRRIDGDCANIARKSANGLVALMLPAGFSSFKLKFEKTRNVLKRKKSKPDTYDDLFYLELKANEMLIEKLNDETKDFYSKISALMFDYMSYGTAIGLLEMLDARNCDLTHIPFLQAGLATTRYEPTQIGLWSQPKPLMAMEIAHDVDCSGVDSNNIINGFINHFYVSGDMIGKSKDSFFELKQSTKNNTMTWNFVPEEIREIKRYKNGCPLLVARINDHGQEYGLGAGLISLPTIKLANYFKNCAKYAAMGVFFPAAAFSADAIVRQGSATSGNPISQDYTEELCTMPGEKIYISSNIDVAQTGQPPMTNLSRPEQMELFEMAAMRCFDSIKDSFLITMIDRLTESKEKSRDPTATEVEAHMNSDPHRFRAEITPFYNKVVYPLVCAIADSVMAELFDEYGEEIAAMREIDPKFLGKHSYEISIYNFEKKQKETERMQNMLTYSQIKAQSNPPEPMSQTIREKIDSSFEEMIS
jgi:hypothetical protein